MPPRKLLITGATGQQGRAVIHALLVHPPAYDHKILALTRNTSSPKAQQLAANDKIELVQGDLNDCEAVFESVGGHAAVWGVFLVTVPDMSGKSGEDQEEIQGKKMVDAAVKYGVQYFVFSSVDRGGGKSETNPTGIKHFVSKHNVEKYLMQKAGGGMEYTILRPVAFMENMTPGMFCKMFNAMWLGMGEQVKLQLVSVKDIGIFAAMAFAHSEQPEWKNKAVGLAGDELTQLEANEVFWKVFGRSMPRTYVFVGNMLQMMVKEVGVMFTWFKEEGYGVDVEGCRKINPAMFDLERWLREESGHIR